MQQITKLRLPFEGSWFVLNGGDTKKLNHHHGNKAQHYAFDFIYMSKESRSFSGDGKSTLDYFSFGKPILSPADGKVIEAVDGVNDNEPGRGNYLAGAGNYIVIEHTPTEYSFIAHLKKSTIEIKTGDKVISGQQLGECGNSGSSFTPHLHYHLQNSKVLLTYQLAYYERDIVEEDLPYTINYTEYASGIKVAFSDVILNGELIRYYSPKQTDLISCNVG